MYRVIFFYQGIDVFMDHLREVFDGELDVIAAVERYQVERPWAIGQRNQNLGK